MGAGLWAACHGDRATGIAGEGGEDRGRVGAAVRSDLRRSPVGNATASFHFFWPSAITGDKRHHHPGAGLTGYWRVSSSGCMLVGRL